jgi:anti-sigma regulatory factor (Ser/Thr protein kinase)
VDTSEPAAVRQAGDGPTLKALSGCRPATGAAVHALGPLSVKVLSRWGLTDPDLQYVVRMCLRELGSNAVRHGPKGPQVTMGVSFQLVRGAAAPHRIIVIVRDEGRGHVRVPHPNEVNEEAEGLRGLSVLCGFGARIDATAHPGGHSVTASIPLDAGERERVCPCACWGHRRGEDSCHFLVERGGGTEVVNVLGLPMTVCRACANAVSMTALPGPRQGPRLLTPTAGGA